MSESARLRSLALAFPSTIRRNDWWSIHYPDLVAKHAASSLEKIWTSGQRAELSHFDREMARYADDPFRGTVERRVLANGETALDLELRAGREALTLAGLGPADVDLVIVSSLRSEGYGVGNAAFVVRELGLRAPGINMESACSSSVVGLQLAASWIASGMARRVLYVVSCTYTRDVDHDDSFSWFLGDGAAAFVVEGCSREQGILGAHSVSTHETCGAFAYHLVERDGLPVLRILPGNNAGPSLRASSEGYLRQCVDGALTRAHLALADVDFFVFNTPLAWFSRFAVSVLGIDESRTISCYPSFANVGPVLMPLNLHAAAAEGRITPGQRVLLYSVGSVSTASCAIIRWGDVAIGAAP